MAGTRLKLKRRVLILFGITAFISVLLVGRTAWLQFVNGEDLQRMAIEQQTRDRIINSKRGTIYDRNGKALAVSASVETVTVNPSVVRKDGNAEETAADLSRILDMSYEDVYTKVTKKSSYEYIKRKIEKEQADEIRNLKTEKKLVGIYLDEDSKRYYPYNNFASHVIGFTGTDNQGLAGIEILYDKYLKGIPGRIVSAKNAAGSDMPYEYERFVSSEDGLNVVLTLDEVVQHFVERHLETALIENKVVNGGAAIVMDVKTGEVLAISTKPDFDLNNPFEISNDLLFAELEELKQNNKEEYSKQRNEILSKIWRNKAVVDLYEPGSTFKIMTTAMALEENVVSVNDTFTCTGVKKVATERIRCWKAGGHGAQNFAQGLQNSCNPVFMEIGERVGQQKFHEYMKGFGFRDKTRIDMPGEAQGLFHQLGNFGIVELATASFGQGFTITPLQLITAVCAVANDGKLMKPRMVRQLTDQEGNIVQSFEPEFVRQVISPETSDLLCELLESVVTVGSGKNAYVKGYRVAGKTGTSEKLPRGSNKKIASFVGFAPADDPQIACIIMLDEPEGDQYYGGVIAAPVVGDILNDILRYLKIEPRYTEEEVKKEDIAVPDLKNKNIAAMKSEVSKAGLKYDIVGGGDMVLSQMPKAGARVSAGSTIMIHTTENPPAEVMVPDLMKKSVLDANAALVNNRLNLKISGSGRGGTINGDTFAVRQEPAGGEVVPAGTIVYVEFRHLEQDY